MSEPRTNLHSDDDLRARLAEVVGEDQADAALAAYEQASIAGLCHEGAWEAAVAMAPWRDGRIEGWRDGRMAR